MLPAEITRAAERKLRCRVDEAARLLSISRCMQRIVIGQGIVPCGRIGRLARNASETLDYSTRHAKSGLRSATLRPSSGVRPNGGQA